MNNTYLLYDTDTGVVIAKMRIRGMEFDEVRKQYTTDGISIIVSDTIYSINNITIENGEVVEHEQIIE